MKQLLVGVSLTCLGAVPALAQQQPASDEIIVTAQQARKQVTSDGNLGALGQKNALETPFNVTTYTSQLILDQQAETLGDVLENEPSVRTTFGFGNQAELFVIRGFPLFGDDIAMDGLFGITPRQLVSPELYEGVQVLNGANAFLFGAAPGGSGIGGGINLIPKRAEKTLLRATASYSADSLFGGNFDVGTRFGADDSFGIRVNGVHRRGQTAIDRDRRSVKVLGASFDFRRGPGRFFFDFGYENQRAYDPRPQVTLGATTTFVPRVPRADANYAQPWTYTKLRDIYAMARVEVDLAPEVMVYAAAGLRDGREDGEYSTITLTNSATGAGTQSRLYVPREDNNEAAQGGIRGKFTVAGISNEFNAGGSINFQENRNAFAFGAFPAATRAACGAGATAFCTNLYAPVYVAKPADSTTPGFNVGNFQNPPRVSRNEFASLFLSDTIGLLNDRILVTVGARRQHLIVDAFNRTSLVRTTRYDRTVTTPVVGVIVRPTDYLSIYGNRIQGLAQGPMAPTNANILNPGQVFAPFKSTQYEAGVKLAIRGLTATAAVYQTRQPNGFERITPVAGRPNATTYVIEGEQRNRGLEVSFNGEPTDWLRLIGGFTLNDAELRRTLNGANDGHDAVGIPKRQVNLGVEVVPPFLKAATLTGRVVHTGSQYADQANTKQLGAWTRFDLGVRYVLVADDHPVTLRLSAENIDNRRYWYSAFNGYLVQGSPRTVKASMTFEY